MWKMEETKRKNCQKIEKCVLLILNNEVPAVISKHIKNIFEEGECALFNKKRALTIAAASNI